MGDEFTALELKAWGNLLAVHGRLVRLIDLDLRHRFGITHAEFEVLLRLSWTPEHRLRIQDLAHQSLLTRSGISRVVDRLAKAGLVTRVGAEEDGRGAYAVLSARGEAEFPTILSEHVAYVRNHFLRHFKTFELLDMADQWERILNDPENLPVEADSPYRRQ